jgi:hypothetical protein
MRHMEQVEAMVTSRGIDFQDWRRAMAASVGAVLVDDLPEPD